MADLITTTELQTYLNQVIVQSDTPEGYVDRIITIISDHIDTYCMGTLFEATQITDERRESYVHGRKNELTVRLKYAPLISVTSLKYRIGSTETTITTTNADLDLEQSMIRLIWYGPLWRVKEKWVTIVSYMAGHTTVPEMVKEAAALLVQEWIDADTRAKDDRDGILSGYRIGNYEERYSVENARIGNLGLGTTRSIRAATLLRKYRRPGVV